MQGDHVQQAEGDAKEQREAGGAARMETMMHGGSVVQAEGTAISKPP